MQIRVVTLRYSEAVQGFPEEALKAATFGKGGGPATARQDGDGREVTGGGSGRFAGGPPAPPEEIFAGGVRVREER